MLNSIPVLALVFAMPRSSSCWTSGASSSVRPMTRKRMLFLRSVPSSSLMYRFSSIISVFTSARGRFQFSTENA